MKRLLSICGIVLLSILGACPELRAQQSDNGDGTYTNPIIWSDFPDNDVIRVGDTYYMVCTTMYFFPGVPVLKSKDLVNWEYLTNAITKFKQHPAYDMNGGTRYGHGQWASSIRYHNGKFYILFVTLDEGGFLCTADKPEGPWELHKLPKAFYDAGLFFDDDGRTYVVSGYSKLSLTEVDAHLAPISKDSVVFDKVQRKGLEGSHMYKINGYYYIYATYGGGDGYQTCLRSKNIYGPYEEKIVLRDDMNQAGRGVHQGALIQTQTGEWWSIIFQDRGGVGRVPTLQPVTWVDGWPIVGKNGRAVVTYRKPGVDKSWPVKILPTSDEFNTGSLGMQWAWNHNPDDSCWSLAARKGFLRLTTAKVAPGLTLARNTLTQRMFGPYSIATTSVYVDKMKTGDIAGLGVLQLPYAFIGIRSDTRTKHILMVNNGKTIDSVVLGNRDHLYLRASANTMKDEVTFAYSFDNINFKALGDTLRMKFNLKMFTGNRFALFNYATMQTGGYVDFDWFRMKTRQGPPNLFAADSRIEAELYDDISTAHVVNSTDPVNAPGLDVAFPADSSSITFNRIDFKKPFKWLKLRAAAPAGGRVNVYVDNNYTRPYVSILLQATNDGEYQTIGSEVKPLIGVHRLRFVFSGTKDAGLDLNWFTFSDK